MKNIKSGADIEAERQKAKQNINNAQIKKGNTQKLIELFDVAEKAIDKKREKITKAFRKKEKNDQFMELYNMFENSEKDLNDTTKKPIEEIIGRHIGKLNLQYKPCEERAQGFEEFLEKLHIMMGPSKTLELIYYLIIFMNIKKWISPRQNTNLPCIILKNYLNNLSLKKQRMYV